MHDTAVLGVNCEVTNSANDREAAEGRVRGRDAEEEKEKREAYRGRTVKGRVLKTSGGRSQNNLH